MGRARSRTPDRAGRTAIDIRVDSFSFEAIFTAGFPFLGAGDPRVIHLDSYMLEDGYVSLSNRTASGAMCFLDAPPDEEPLVECTNELFDDLFD